MERCTNPGHGPDDCPRRDKIGIPHEVREHKTQFLVHSNAPRIGTKWYERERRSLGEAQEFARELRREGYHARIVIRVETITEYTID